MIDEKNVPTEKTEMQYPAAELLQQICYDDYRRLLETYDKIYDKVNYMLAFCGILLLVIIGSVDYTLVQNLFLVESNSELLMILLLLCCSIISAICIVWAVIGLLLLMRSKKLLVFNSIDIRNENIYQWNVDQASVWLIEKYTVVVDSMRTTIREKQTKYDSAITKVIVSIIMYAIVLIVGKGI